MRTSLFGCTLQELKYLIEKYQIPSYTATQVAQWLYQKDVAAIDEMTNLSKKARDLFNQYHIIGKHKPIQVQKSKDGTKKYLYPTTNGECVETVLIPEKERNTLCISTQVGCKMRCQFCSTGAQGFKGHLSAGDIVNQIVSLPERSKLTNIVYMGMGEPLDNYQEVKKSIEIITSKYGMGVSPRRITLSTVGVIPQMKEFLEETKVNLAISLHSPFPEERQKLIPLEKKYPLTDVIQELKKHDFTRYRKLSLEYILFKDINDTLRHAQELLKISKSLQYCRVNLIGYNGSFKSKFIASDRGTTEMFQNYLKSRGVNTTLRRSRGADIQAACGMLAGKNLKAKKL